jgi:hypothetical protein
MDVFDILVCHLMNFWKFHLPNNERENKEQRQTHTAFILSNIYIYVHSIMMNVE